MSYLRKPDKQSYLRILFYGKPGSTKTRTSYSAAFVKALSPVLVLESGGNPESTYDYLPSPTIVTMEKLKDLNGPYDWLVKGAKPDHVFAQAFELEQAPKTVIVDGITDVQRTSFGKVTGNETLGPGDFGGRVQRQHFGTVLEQMTRMAKSFYSLPYHVIVTALEKNQNNDQGNLLRIAPLIWGQSENEISGYALAVARLVHQSAVSPVVKQFLKSDGQTVGKDDSVALWMPDGIIQAKDQYGRLPKFTVGTTMEMVYDHIYQGEGSYRDPSAS